MSPVARRTNSVSSSAPAGGSTVMQVLPVSAGSSCSTPAQVPTPLPANRSSLRFATGLGAAQRSGISGHTASPMQSIAGPGRALGQSQSLRVLPSAGTNTPELQSRQSPATRTALQTLQANATQAAAPSVHL